MSTNEKFSKKTLRKENMCLAKYLSTKCKVLPMLNPSKHKWMNE